MTGIREAIRAASRRPVFRVVFVALLITIATTSLLVLVREAFILANWADALSYAEGSRRVFSSITPYSAMQLAGPYPLDDAAWGLGFVYPPTGAYLLFPFVFGEPFWYVWNAISVASLLGIVLLIVRRELGTLSLPVGIGVAAVTLLHPGLSELRVGFLSPMLAAGMGSMWLWPRWSAVPALLFGLIEVFPAAGLIWTFRKQGNWKATAVASAVAFAVAIPLTLAHPDYFRDWLTALSNVVPGCPNIGLVSFACLGLPLVGYVLGGVLLLASWAASRDDVSFALLGLGMTVPLPDLYWGNLLVPMVAALPLMIRLLRTRYRLWSPCIEGQPGSASVEVSRSASSIE